MDSTPLLQSLQSTVSSIFLKEVTTMSLGNTSSDIGGTLSSNKSTSDNESLNRLLDLHNAIGRYYNYTQEAQSDECQPRNPDELDIYSVAASYKQLHGYIALFVCTFGVISNCLIMVVLRRKEMRTPVNLMLFALAIADLLIMLEYIPFAINRYLIKMDQEQRFSWSFAVFVFFHVHFTQIIHTISIQLTLSMAIWRYAAIKCSNRSSTFCTFKRCYQVIVAAYICPLFFCILNYLYFQIAEKKKYLTGGAPRPFDEIDAEDKEKKDIFEAVCNFLGQSCNMTEVNLYLVESSDLVTKKYPILHQIHFWTFSVLIKLIPCFVLTFFMCWLVNTLYKARRHHKMLENKSALPLNPLVASQNGECQAQSPSKVVGGKLIHPEIQQKKVGVSPSRSIRFAPNNTPEKSHHQNSSPQEDNENPKASLLNSEHGSNGTMIVNQGKNPTDSLPVSNASVDGRRPSEESGASNSSVGEGSASSRRFTKGFIRFPSKRRPSTDKGKSSKTLKRTDRTSKMLIAVLLLFLLTEFPQGIMHFLTGWYGPEFLKCKYNPWAEIWDILALINSAINFILYCFMSKQFRTQFQISFKLHLCFKKKWITLTHCNNNQTVSTTV